MQLKWGAVVLCGGILLLLQLWANQRDVPLVEIDQIAPKMNYRTIRVEGVLETAARAMSSGAVLYVVNDGTGTLAVFSNEIPEEALPRAGSRVTATGNLSIGVGHQVRLQVRHVELLEEPITDNFISEFRLATITPQLAGDRITLVGYVSKIWTPRAGSRAPHKIIVKDPSATLEVIHWLKRPPDVHVGQAVEITGIVGLFEGKLQLRLRRTDDLKSIAVSSYEDP